MAASIEALNAQLAQAKATLAQQQAAENQAELNLGYTTIAAPFDGTVGVRTVTVGQYVEPGAQLMAVVPLRRELQRDRADRRAARAASHD